MNQRDKMKEISVIHGPNLNLLGSKERASYGNFTLAELNEKILTYAEQNGIFLKIGQFNVEGRIVEAIHDASDMDGVVINPAAYTHYSYSIRSAVESVPAPAIEVHISNIHHGNPFRKNSVIAPACVGQICGLGWQGYLLAIKYLLTK